MINVTIKFDDNYRRFCKSVSQEENKMNDKILNSLYDLGVIQDGPEDCGLTIEELCVKVGMLPVIVMQDVFNSFVGVLQLFQSLVIIGQAEDCPQCGWLLEQEYDGKFEVNKCLNKSCDYELSNLIK